MCLHVTMYLMCGPKQLFFFQCGPETPKVGTLRQLLIWFVTVSLAGSGVRANRLVCCINGLPLRTCALNVLSAAPAPSMWPLLAAYPCADLLLCHPAMLSCLRWKLLPLPGCPCLVWEAFARPAGHSPEQKNSRLVDRRDSQALMCLAWPPKQPAFLPGQRGVGKRGRESILSLKGWDREKKCPFQQDWAFSSGSWKNEQWFLSILQP